MQLDTYVSDKRQTFIFQLVAYEMVNIIARKTFRNLMIKNTIVSKCWFKDSILRHDRSFVNVFIRKKHNYKSKLGTWC